VFFTSLNRCNLIFHNSCYIFYFNLTSLVIFDRLAVETMQSVCLMDSGDNISDSLKEETNLMGLTFGGYLQSKVYFFFVLSGKIAIMCNCFYNFPNYGYNTVLGYYFCHHLLMEVRCTMT